MLDSYASGPSKRRFTLLFHFFYLSIWVLSIATFWAPLRQLVSLALGDERYTHLVLVPLISACLIYSGRSGIFRARKADLRPAIPVVLVAAAAGWFLSLLLMSGRNGYRLTFLVLVTVLAWVGGFLLCYGVRAFHPARFPLLFLLLMIPLPEPLMKGIIRVLQIGASYLVYAWFWIAGMPLFRQGFTFELPGGSIVIAEECASIHSTWALFIASLLVGHFFLRSLPAKIGFSLLSVPIAVFTNSVRIVIIWFLSYYVDRSYLTGNLHHHGGILFSLNSLFVLLLALWIVRKTENRLLAPPVSIGELTRAMDE